MKARSWFERKVAAVKAKPSTDRDSDADTARRRDVDYLCERDEADDWLIPSDDCDVRY